jgi:hypothetical protein
MKFASRLHRSLSRPVLQRLKTLGRLASQRHQEAVLVGGPVRDLILGRTSLDIDVVVTHPAEPLVREFVSLARGRIEHRSPFMTYGLTFPDGSRMDIATARKETYSHPATLPVVQPAELLHDLARRDFSVNAMGIILGPHHFGKLLDPFGGVTDLNTRTLKALHSQSFVDDPTRIYRAARYAGRLGLTLDEDTGAWMRKSIREKLPAKLSPARAGHEWEKILTEEDPRNALRRLDEWGALSFLSPYWHWRPGHEKIMDPRFCGDSLSSRLMAWCRPFGVRKTMTALPGLEIPSRIRGEVILGLGLLEAIKKGDPLAALGTVRASDTVKQFLAGSLPAPVWKRVLESRPHLSGSDLLNLRVLPGPEMGRLLAGLAVGHWHRRLSSRRDEVRFVTLEMEKRGQVDNRRGR